jgi:7,8-dihydro-6-hydroxymethylpterin-pyrophosphokinase
MMAGVQRRRIKMRNAPATSDVDLLALGQCHAVQPLRGRDWIGT